MSFSLISAPELLFEDEKLLEEGLKELEEPEEAVVGLEVLSGFPKKSVLISEFVESEVVGVELELELSLPPKKLKNPPPEDEAAVEVLGMPKLGVIEELALPAISLSRIF